MNIMEFIKELLIGLSIAILLPSVSYWGIYAFYTSGIDKQISQLQQQENIEIGKPQDKVNELLDKRRTVNFFAFNVIGVLAILLGLMLSIQSLSVGLIGGGIINLLLGISHSLHSPLYMFFCLVMLLVFLISIALFKKYKQISQ